MLKNCTDRCTLAITKRRSGHCSLLLILYRNKKSSSFWELIISLNLCFLFTNSADVMGFILENCFSYYEAIRYTHSVWPQTFTISFNDGFLYLVVLHLGHPWSSISACTQQKTRENVNNWQLFCYMQAADSSVTQKVVREETALMKRSSYIMTTSTAVQTDSGLHKKSQEVRI